jgi:hypothetical protein
VDQIVGGVDSLERAVETRCIEDVTLHDIDAVGRVVPAGISHQRPHVVASGHQCGHQMGADEAGRPGHEDTHVPC